MTATITQPVPGTLALHPIAQKIRQIMAELRLQFQERDELIECAALSLVSNEGVFILGFPGTGKSYFCRAFYGRIIGARFFEKALSGLTPIESLFGAPDMGKLVNESAFVRKTKGTLLDCHFALIDEFGRANGMVMDECLPVFNERIAHEVDPATGDSFIRIPLRSFMGGSNSLPTEENESAAAFFDRLLLRVEVKPIQEMGNLIAMLESGAVPVPNPTTLTLDEVDEAANVLVPAVRIPRDVIQAAAQLRFDLAAKSIEVSDRRLNQCMKLVRAHAFLAGRDEATTQDLAVLRYALWSEPSHRKEVHRLSTSVSNPLGDKINEIADKIEEIGRELRKIAAKPDREVRAKEYTQQMGNANVVAQDLEAQVQSAKQNGYSTKELDELTTRLARTKQEIMDAAMANMNS